MFASVAIQLLDMLTLTCAEFNQKYQEASKANPSQKQQPSTVKPLLALRKAAGDLLCYYFQKRGKKWFLLVLKLEPPCFSLHNVPETILEPFPVPNCYQRFISNVQFTYNAEQDFNHVTRKGLPPLPSYLSLALTNFSLVIIMTTAGTHLLTHQCHWVVDTSIDDLCTSSNSDSCERLIIPHSATNSVFSF